MISAPSRPYSSPRARSSSPEPVPVTMLSASIFSRAAVVHAGQKYTLWVVSVDTAGDAKLDCPRGADCARAWTALVPPMQGSLSLKIAGPAELLLERADGTRCSIHPLWLRERCKDA